MYHGEICGRTDIVVADSIDFQIHSSFVKYAIEIKRSNDLTTDKMNGPMREAQTQLIGLNINNYSRSPCVILTNLENIHLLFQLIRKEQEEIYSYEIVVYKCDSFPIAVEQAEIISSDKKNYISFDFGRGPSPVHSAQGNEDNQSN
eukprot:c21472_g5_i2.p1 GENE.c21472_g5_i2~~c21472_g5_i2.p1  ORF type:complete len:146 (-),score=2.68 c21472_g5_i2:187-624(-)